MIISSLQLVNVVAEIRDTFLKTLSLSDSHDDFIGLGGGIKWITGNFSPVMEDTLREGLSSGQSSQVSSETERFRDGKEGLNLVKGGTLDGLFFRDDTSSLVEALVNTSHSVEGSGDFGQEDGFLESWLGGELSGVVDSSGSGDKLTTTSVDGISVEGNINDVDSDLSHVFLAHGSFLGGPLEGRLHGVLDFVHELNSLGHIDQHVGSGVFRSEAPDSLGFFLVPFELFVQSLGSELGVVLWSDVTLFDQVGETFLEGLGGTVESVVLVGRLGETDLVGNVGDGFLVGNDGVGLLDFAVSVFLLQVVQADFDVEFTATGNDVLAGLFVDDEDEGIRLGELVKTVDQLGEILGVLGLNGDSDDWRDGVLHNSDVVGIVVIGDGTGLDEVLIDTDQTDGVTAWDVGDVFDGSAHHEDGSLDGLDVQVVLLAGLVVGAHNSDLLAGEDGSGEDSTESEETTLIGGGDHLGDVEHKGTLGVAFSDTLSADIVLGTFVEESDSVSLGGLGGREMENHHFKEGVGSVEPVGHDGLEELLALEFLVFGGEGEVDDLEHLVHLLGVTFHDGSGKLDDGFHTELDEGSLEGLAGIGLGLGLPLLGVLVEEVVTPELGHKLVLIDLELGGVHSGELGQGEAPAFLSGTEGDVTLGGVDEEVTHIRLFVVGDDDVGQIDDSDEVLVHGLTVELELEDGSVDLVDHENGSDLLTHSLSEDSFGLDTNTFDTIDDDEGTVSNSEGSGNFRGEIDVSRGIDEVDEVRGLGSGSVDIVLVVEGDTSGLDGNTSFLLILTGIGVTGITSSLVGDDTSLANQRVTQS